ncbi:hypothetical protein [Acidithrix ferrooxidans]|uniref:Uncharacterized protein n=1 Tax=Acidithrix ferrooxidans TaxID=1280514 RepID=A0A0D8HHT4_9ACTN|nr:hypothetical protein [Acidithrix ferrooxidans]KJF16641.1 hypothetical protein AXFE_25040 [Acidithrix ferrooxidans]
MSIIYVALQCDRYQLVGDLQPLSFMTHAERWLAFALAFGEDPRVASFDMCNLGFRSFIGASK